MEANFLKPSPGSRKNRKRIGRGMASGTGKTSSRGHGGQKCRSGYTKRAWFEGGQMPLQRRLPKRGFHNPFRVEYQVISLAQLNKYEDNDVVNLTTLTDRGMIKGSSQPVKLLANGELERKLEIEVHGISKSAQAQVEKMGGTVQLLPVK